MLKHMRDNWIVLDQQSRALDLAWCVTVADVPGEPRQVVAINGQEGLSGSGDLDQLPALRLKSIAMIKRKRVLKIGDKRPPVSCRQLLSPEEPVFVGKGAGFGGTPPGSSGVACLCDW